MPSLEEQAIAHALGELNDVEAQAFDVEVRTNPQAAQLLTEAQRLLAGLRHPLMKSTLFAVPDGVRARLKSLLTPSTSVGSGGVSAVSSFIERVLQLVFDSDAQPALAGGLRGASEVRRLRFESEKVAVELTVSSVDAIANTSSLNSRRIMGSVEGLVPPTSVVFESPSSDSRFVLSTDQDGFFELSLPAGSWSVAVASGDELFRITGLSFGS